MRSIQLGTESGATFSVQLQRADDDQTDHYHVRINGQQCDVEVQRLDESSGYLRHRGCVVPYYVARDHSDVQVWVNGRVFALTVHTGAARETVQPGAARIKNLTAPMPGTILKILVSPGETFDAHHPLVIMESMKMEMTLSAAARGQVAQIMCTEGELVENGTLLIKLDEPNNHDESA